MSPMEEKRDSNTDPRNVILPNLFRSTSDPKGQRHVPMDNGEKVVYPNPLSMFLKRHNTCDKPKLNLKNQNDQLLDKLNRIQAKVDSHKTIIDSFEMEVRKRKKRKNTRQTKTKKRKGSLDTKGNLVCKEVFNIEKTVVPKRSSSFEEKTKCIKTSEHDKPTHKHTTKTHLKELKKSLREKKRSVQEIPLELGELSLQVKKRTKKNKSKIFTDIDDLNDQF